MGTQTKEWERDRITEQKKRLSEAEETEEKLVHG